MAYGPNYIFNQVCSSEGFARLFWSYLEQALQLWTSLKSGAKDVYLDLNMNIVKAQQQPQPQQQDNQNCS